MESRGSWQPEFNSPEQQLRNLASADFSRLSREASDPQVREIAAVLREKFELKSRIDQMQMYQDDIGVYQQMKRLGLMMVLDQTWKHEPLADKETGFALLPDDKYLDIHIPPVTEENKNFEQITASFGLVAQYIWEHNLQPKYVLGITYHRLARISRRYGFELINLPLPAEITASIAQVYKRFVSDKDDMGGIYLCFQETDKFVGRFG